MKIGFVTCVELGLACMEEIYSVGGSLGLVLTLPDDRAVSKSGRVFVDDFCDGHQIPLVKVSSVNDAGAQLAVRQHEIDWLCIIGWSQIAGREILAAPRRGALGMHPTLLPEGRGRAAIPWAILRGLPRTGVTLFQLTEGVDSGPILAQEHVPILLGETATTLYAKISIAHRSLIRRAWPDLLADRLEGWPQEEERASYWPGRRPDDGRLFPEMTVEAVDRMVRAVTRPYPGAFIDTNGGRLRIWSGTVEYKGYSPPPAAVALKFHDGKFWATETQFESTG